MGLDDTQSISVFISRESVRFCVGVFPQPGCVIWMPRGCCVTNVVCSIEDVCVAVR